MGEQKVIEALFLHVILLIYSVDRLDWRVALNNTFVTPGTALVLSKHALGSNTDCAVFKHGDLLHWHSLFTVTDGTLALHGSHINWKDTFGAHQGRIDTILFVLW